MVSNGCSVFWPSKDAMTAYKKGDAAGFGDRIGAVGASNAELPFASRVCRADNGGSPWTRKKMKEVQFGKGSHTGKLLWDGQIENHGFEISEIFAEIIWNQERKLGPTWFSEKGRLFWGVGNPRWWQTFDHPGIVVWKYFSYFGRQPFHEQIPSISIYRLWTTRSRLVHLQTIRFRIVSKAVIAFQQPRHPYLLGSLLRLKSLLRPYRPKCSSVTF